MDRFSTHEIDNQVDPLPDYSLFTTDDALREGVLREGAAASVPALEAHGAWLGLASTRNAGRLANRYPPELIAFDEVGRRVDRIECHPAWTTLLSGIWAQGLHTGPSGSLATAGQHMHGASTAGSHVARIAGYLMQGQVEAGTLCPTTMTFAARAVLEDEPAGEIDLARDWLPLMRSTDFDPSDQPITHKRSALIGMGLTEKQGGSDLRDTRTRAAPLNLSGASNTQGRGQAYRLVGHKWFYSVPQSDAHLVLAQADSGLSCFFVPRWRPDGTRNAVHIQRLKDKLGNRSNPSAEVEFCDAWGVMVGEPGRGLPLLMKMATLTRLDCVAGSAALLRQAVVQAMHHTAGRQAFGARLLDQPLMRHVLADLALESEAATALALRLAGAFDRPDDPLERAIRRIVTPAAKYWVTKRAVAAIGECLETWGGNGYVETGPMPRLFREAPVNAIWEGSGNVMCLDVQRAIAREPESFAVLVAELRNGVGIHSAYDRALDECLVLCAEASPYQARRVASLLALLLQSAILMRHAPLAVSQAFIAARLGGSSWLAGDGAVPEALVDPILARAWPPAAAAAAAPEPRTTEDPA
ncbi:acyl-CoA dehydrogenase family protein [Pigmentiphaga litoralis]|uniref:acyl-CoA dehydrogenase family protein n=1 Tax=Pigmentiphaga litoralis TaxID=516702 RepID=UPI003B432ED7